MEEDFWREKKKEEEKNAPKKKGNAGTRGKKDDGTNNNNTEKVAPKKTSDTKQVSKKVNIKKVDVANQSKSKLTDNPIKRVKKK